MVEEDEVALDVVVIVTEAELVGSLLLPWKFDLISISDELLLLIQVTVVTVTVVVVLVLVMETALSPDETD